VAVEKWADKKRELIFILKDQIELQAYNFIEKALCEGLLQIMFKVAKSYFKVFLWWGTSNFLIHIKGDSRCKSLGITDLFCLIVMFLWLTFLAQFKSQIHTTGAHADWCLCSVCCCQHWLGHSVFKYPNHVGYYIQNKNRVLTKYFLLFIHHNVSQRTIFHHFISWLRI
jgi:hypothetical protein